MLPQNCDYRFFVQSRELKYSNLSIRLLLDQNRLENFILFSEQVLVLLPRKSKGTDDFAYKNNNYNNNHEEFKQLWVKKCTKNAIKTKNKWHRKKEYAKHILNKSTRYYSRGIGKFNSSEWSERSEDWFEINLDQFWRCILHRCISSTIFPTLVQNYE